jgi:hypothetical protein
MQRIAFLALLVAVPLLGSCRLTEVSLPAGADVVVVEAVLRAGARQQYLLLHRSMDGRTIRGEPGAAVTVFRQAGPPIEFTESHLLDCLTLAPQHWSLEDVVVEASCYVSRLAAGRFVHPGQEYELLVETERGERLRGRTRVPGAFGFRSPAVTLNTLSLTAHCALPTYPFTMSWSQSEGAWSYLTSLHLARWSDALQLENISVPDPIELTGVSVSAADTSFLFPENLGLFQRGDFDQRLFLLLQRGLPPGADATMAILAGDRNYTNAIRGGRFNPSGNVRSSSVVGDGVGVFGSIVPIVIRSTHSPSEPPLAPCQIPPSARVTAP